MTDPDNPRLANFRDLGAGDRRPVTARGSVPVIVEGVPAVQRLLASHYRVRAVLGAGPRGGALELPDGVSAYEADKWVLSEVVGFRLTRGVPASADRSIKPISECVTLRNLVRTAPARRIDRDHHPRNAVAGHLGDGNALAFDIAVSASTGWIAEWAVTALALPNGVPTIRWTPARLWLHNPDKLMQLPSGYDA